MNIGYSGEDEEKSMLKYLLSLNHKNLKFLLIMA